MIRSEIRVFDNFDGLTAAVRQKTIRGHEAASLAGQRVAKARAGNVSDFTRVPTHGTSTGFASGLNATSPLAQIFDGGSLGKRQRKLKPGSRRRESWQVTRRGETYSARRSEDLAGKGVAPRNIFTPARTAGRRALIDSIKR